MSRQPSSLASYQLSWPRTVDQRAVAAFFRALASEAAAGPVVLDAVGVGGSVRHYLTLPSSRADVTLRRLAAFPQAPLYLIRHALCG